MATRNQIRLSFLMWMVVLADVGFRRNPIRRLGDHRVPLPDSATFAIVMPVRIIPHLMDSRVWEVHHLNPKNRVMAPKTLSR